MTKMVRKLLAILSMPFFTALGMPAVGAREKPATTPVPLVLDHASVFDSESARFRPGRTLIISDGLIVDEFDTGTKPVPAGADVRDLRGKFVIPGLIDAHVHVASDPSGSDNRDAAEADLLKALRGGVTFVRDMAGDGRALADLGRAIAAGDIPAPGMRYAALMAGPGFFADPRTIMSSKGETPGRTPWARAVADNTDLVLAVAEAHGTGASAVKIYAQVAPALIARIVGEAHRQGMAAWSHATVAPSKPGEIVDAGVDVVSHADQLVWEAMPRVDPGGRALAFRWLDEDVRGIRADDPAIGSLLRRMKERGTILDATVSLYTASVETAERQFPQYVPAVKACRAFAYAVTRLAHEIGVDVCAGTDGMFKRADSPLPALHDEMETLVANCGFRPAEALSAATKGSARALGISMTHGAIGRGKAADLLVLGADPTIDIRNTRAIELVIKFGRPVL